MGIETPQWLPISARQVKRSLPHYLLPHRAGTGQGMADNFGDTVLQTLSIYAGGLMIRPFLFTSYNCLRGYDDEYRHPSGKLARYERG